jgi:carboxypeptidase family protein/TonB-dependent receptor-like protein
MTIRRVYLICLTTAVAWAQAPYGRVTGRVADAAGAVVPGAAIRVTNIATNVVTTTASDSAGSYDALNLIPGQYKLVVEMQGFKTYERGPIEVRVGDVLTVDVSLQLGVVSENVTVTAEVPLLESANASLGQVVENRRLRDLPLPYSNPMYLIQLTAGVISTTAPNSNWAINQPEGISNFSANGTTTSGNEFTVDGTGNMLSYGYVNWQPAPEMVQEMRIQTAPYDASVGHFSGALVQIATRAGTNTLHGAVNWGFNSEALNTRPFFVNRTIYDLSGGPVTQAKINRYFPPTTLNRARAMVSGPLWIPGIYNGKNRTFFTFGFDKHMHVYTSNPNFKTVPTAAERSGDLSALLALGTRYQIYDPASIAVAPGGRFSRQPLPNNIVPASRINSVSKSLLAFYPLPNASGTADGLNNYFSTPVWHEMHQNELIRVDQVVSPNHRFFVSVLPTLEDSLWSSSGWDNVQLFQHQWVPGANTTVDDVISIRPNLVLNLRYGFIRLKRNSLPNSQGSFDLTSLGFPASLAGQIDKTIMAVPVTSFTAVSGIGTTGTSTRTDYHSWQGNLAYNRGNHAFRFGGEFRVYQQHLYSWGNASGTFTFGSSWTNGPIDNSPAAPIGQDIATFLLGLPTGGGIDRNASVAQQSKYTALFFQDDWKLSRRLTLNLGLRYELELPTTERFNRSTRGFDFSVANPIQAAAQANYARNPIPEVPAGSLSTPGGLLFAGVNGVPRGLWQTDANNFEPRVGLAYQLRSRTVLRAGYGVFFESNGADRNTVPQTGFSQRTNLIPSLDNGLNFQATLSNPFPGGLLSAPGASGGLTTYLGNSVTFFWPDLRSAYEQRWSLNVQHELPNRVLLDVGYVGNRGTGLGMSQSLNNVPAQYLSKSPVRDQATINFLSAAVPNPFSGLPQFAGTSLSGTTVSRSQLLLPYPQFSGLSTTFDAGFSWYHALQLKAEKRFSHGLILNATYTWSKLMEATSKLNSQDPWPAHSISSLDRPQHLLVSGVYELPVGKGRHFLGGARGLVNHAVGNWSIQAIYQGQSGPAIGFGNIILNGDLHNLVLPHSERTVARWFNTAAGFETDSTKQLGSNLRTFPLRLTGLRADGYNNWDISVLKDFMITERVAFQVRGEATDALNHAMFGQPNTTPTSTLFGQVTSTIGVGARVIVINGRLTW